ncbi:5-formyltetrahydrofolate cyclo-ligase [Rhodohalobacter sp. 614A]|uniref:5-formyltetrahydrofolate cyclo-ligase n=1 Tax=Rhodohalobacter sp. 614A TaxID=2908649 RepID=UPI001F23CAB0|nr:5-formyltetrahydrofolate cyclo-ligase [Rhodohalobacter sp. 614A]
MSAPSISKKKLRRFFLVERMKLSEVEVETKSESIINRVLESDEFKKAQTVHTYISIKEKNEVRTFPFIEACFKEQKRVVVPKIVGDGTLEHIELNSLDDLTINNWGVPEPPTKKQVPIDTLDLIIVPMVAGDRSKNRLGYGKGFYDRFLEISEAVKIGLLFDCQLYNNKLPVESFDIPLDILITESQRIE